MWQVVLGYMVAAAKNNLWPDLLLNMKDLLPLKDVPLFTYMKQKGSIIFVYVPI